MKKKPSTTPPTGMRAPDPILAELWEIKRQLNAESGYDVRRRSMDAHKAAEAIRRKLAERAL